MENNFYVYMYLREDGTPYYVGKGRGRRAYSKARQIPAPKEKSRIVFSKQNLTEEEAFQHEIELISLYGRKDNGTGILRNLTDGGDGVSGYIMTEETKRKMSESLKGKTPSEETKRKLSEAGKCRTHSEETRKKLSEGMKGNTWNIGRTHSEEAKKKMSELAKGKIHTEETKRKISKARKAREISKMSSRPQKINFREKEFGP